MATYIHEWICASAHLTCKLITFICASDLFHILRVFHFCTYNFSNVFSAFGLLFGIFIEQSFILCLLFFPFCRCNVRIVLFVLLSPERLFLHSVCFTPFLSRILFLSPYPLAECEYIRFVTSFGYCVQCSCTSYTKHRKNGHFLHLLVAKFQLDEYNIHNTFCLFRPCLYICDVGLLLFFSSHLTVSFFVCCYIMGYILPVHCILSLRLYVFCSISFHFVRFFCCCCCSGTAMDLTVIPFHFVIIFLSFGS